MTGKGYKMPNELSGGEQQRIVIARAILNRPDIILADEPTGNLDTETGRKIVELLKSICATGSAIMMTTIICISCRNIRELSTALRIIISKK